jgi:DNA-binding PadR family transcriptional regulator
MASRVSIDANIKSERPASGNLRSPVSWALLGLVIHRPSYGYELVQRFERTHGDALGLSSMSQIYTALDTLKRRGLIEELATDGDSPTVRQPKPHYRATADGVREHREWLIGQLTEERRRSRLFVRQIAMLPPADGLAVIERFERACLREAAAARPNDREACAEGSTAIATRLLGEEHRLSAGAKLSWIAYARRQLTALLGQ